jgi:hypothetical protein
MKFYQYLKKHFHKIFLELFDSQQIFSISKDLAKHNKKVFNELPLTYKMKIKKEKAKLLLGEKTKRMNIDILQANATNDSVYNYNNYKLNAELELEEKSNPTNKNNIINKAYNESSSNSSNDKKTKKNSLPLNDLLNHNEVEENINNNFNNKKENYNNNCNDNNNKLNLQNQEIKKSINKITNFHNLKNTFQALNEIKEKEFARTKNINFSKNKENEKSNSDSEFDFTSDLHLKEGKDYIIENDKLIILNDNPDEKTKKEIRILRNRISAQKSRDRNKMELREFKQFSNTLSTENEYLKGQLGQKETESLLLKIRIKNFEEKLCENCQHLITFDPKKPKSSADFDKSIINRDNKNNFYNITHNNSSNNSIDNSKNINIINHIDNKTNTRNYNFNNINNNSNDDNYNNNAGYSPNIIDISSASRRNFSNNLKIGVFAGLLVILFVLGCVLWGQFDEINSKITRQLFSLYDGKLTKSSNSGLIQNTNKNIKAKIFNITKNYPIVKYGKANDTNLTQSQNKKISSNNDKNQNINYNKVSGKSKGSKALEKITSKLAEYNFSRYNLENLKNFLRKKKSEFLANIAKKLHEKTVGFNKDIENVDKKKMEIGKFLWIN